MYIVHRKLTDPSKKKNWVPKNRKYKWMFYGYLIFDVLKYIALYYYLKK